MTKLVVFFLLATTGAYADLVSGEATLTFSANSPDSSAVTWQGVRFGSDLVELKPEFGSNSWDLRLKQGYVSTNKGSAARLKDVPFESVTEAPADTAFAADTTYDPSGPAKSDIYNGNLMNWGDYYLLPSPHHLFYPYNYVHVVKTASGNYAKLQFIDYIKEGYAMCRVNETSFTGRKVVKIRSVKVRDEDDKVVVRVRYVYNTIAGDKKLGEEGVTPVAHEQANWSCPPLN